MDPYTTAEVTRVLNAAESDDLEVARHLTLYGLRRGEIAGLRWSCVDLAGKTLTIDPSTVKRWNPSPRRSAANGRSRSPRNSSRCYSAPSDGRQPTGSALARPGPESGFVVVNNLGVQIYPDTLSDKWDQLVERAGVWRIRLHDARQTCGTLMHLQGVPIMVISA